MAEKVPLPGTGLELSSSDGLTGNAGTVAKGGIGFGIVFVMLAIGAALFKGASNAAGQGDEVDIPVA